MIFITFTILIYLFIIISQLRRKNLTLISFVLYTYVAATLVLFVLSINYGVMNPLFIISQAFLVLGLISFKYNSVPIIFSIWGLFGCLLSINILSEFYTTLGILILFSLTPISVYYLDKNNKRRLLKKGGTTIEGECVDYDWTYKESRRGKLYTPIIEYYVKNKKYQAKSSTYTSFRDMPEKGTKIEILVNLEKPTEVYIPPLKKIPTFEIVWLIFGLAITLLYFFQ